MMLLQASWQDQQTFRMIPINDNCPYVECIFDPGTKVFVVISKIKKTHQGITHNRSKSEPINITTSHAVINPIVHPHIPIGRCG